jgi:DNA-binding MarR family transcriptional regulator
MEGLNMNQNEMIENIRQFLKKLPDIKAGLALEGFSLLSLHREVEMLSEGFAGRHGLSARQIETLERLFHSPDCSLTPAQIAEGVHLTRSAMTSNLDSLERKGYLTRATHKDDRRMVKVTLSKAGVDYCEKQLPVRYRDITKIMSVLSKEERRVLAAAYEKVADCLREILKEEQIDCTEAA